MFTAAQEEFDNISRWTKSNNLKLNASKTIKTKELNVCRRRFTVDSDHIQPIIKETERVAIMKVLGVVINSRLTMKDYLSSCAFFIHALIMLRTQGLPDKQIHVVTTTTTLASLLFASPVC